MCAHLPTRACTGHTRYAHTCMCAHISTHVQSHILCAHMQEFAYFICVHTSIQHTGVPFHMCAHTFHMCIPAHAHPRAGTRVHTHTCTRACGLAHPPSCRQAVSLVPQRRQLFQASGWLPPCLLGLRGSPFVPACRGLGAPSQALLQAGSSAPSILHTLLFLQNMRLEIPPREACLLSPAGGEPASLGSCVPLGANHHQTSSLLWALADGPHLCPSVWREA